jgi:hypothetical protein
LNNFFIKKQERTLLIKVRSCFFQMYSVNIQFVKLVIMLLGFIHKKERDLLKGRSLLKD